LQNFSIKIDNLWSFWNLTEPRVNLIIFVYSVAGLDPGIYLLARNIDSVSQLKSQMPTDFLFSRKPEWGNLPLFLLKPDVANLRGNWKEDGGKEDKGEGEVRVSRWAKGGKEGEGN
jgi:hypothetical protein